MTSLCGLAYIEATPNNCKDTIQQTWQTQMPNQLKEQEQQLLNAKCQIRYATEVEKLNNEGS